RMNAYGLQQNQDGRTYHLWFQPASGQPVDGGALDPDQNGSGFAMATDLPGLDQGKAVLLTLDASGAKQPGETVVKADLPQLKPTLPKPGPQQQGAPQEPGQARSGTDTQQMHQSGK
ncbi:MAG TPA: anti-sigma factor, partial [Myxococcales bacterium]|nr:anti-sigma factor [Myxococcales bacterium]